MTELFINGEKVTYSKLRKRVENAVYTMIRRDFNVRNNI